MTFARAIRRLALGFVLVGLTLAGHQAPAGAAGTAFNVDTAEVSDPGNCKVEGWTSHASNRDQVTTTNPSCVAGLATPTEIGLQMQRARSDDEWSTALTLKAKAKLLPTAIGSFGWAAVTAVTYDTTAREVSAVYAYIPGTLRLSETVRINVSGGWVFDKPTDRHLGTYGLGLDWRFTETLTLTVETFGQAGASTDNPWDTRARFQTGVRYRPIDRLSFDLIYGRNNNGENADWFTLGTTVRFPAQ